VGSVEEDGGAQERIEDGSENEEAVGYCIGADWEDLGSSLRSTSYDYQKVANDAGGRTTMVGATHEAAMDH
jgi:hypothetical protein